MAQWRTDRGRTRDPVGELCAPELRHELAELGVGAAAEDHLRIAWVRQGIPAGDAESIVIMSSGLH